MYSVLRHHMSFLTALTKSEPGLPRFNWNLERTVLTIDSNALLLNDIYKMMHSRIARMEANIARLFRGCEYQDILCFIDEKLHPDHVKDWFCDKPRDRSLGQSFVSNPDNGLVQFQDRLVTHLANDPELFVRVAGERLGKTGLFFPLHVRLCSHNAQVTYGIG